MWPRRDKNQKLGALPGLRRQLAAHVLLNNCQIEAAPLLLCIVGATGEGKTFNIKIILKELGISIYEISASAFAHHKEGMALFPFIRSYRDASSSIAQGKQSALLIDDIDRSIAFGYENSGHTIHSQLLTGLIMDLCDNPYSIPDEATREMRECHRVPIIFTANQIKGLDAALRRPQRMTIFNYSLTENDRIDLLKKVFFVSGFGVSADWATPISENDLIVIEQKFKGQPIAFFADIVSEFWKDVAITFLEKEMRISSAAQIKQLLSRELSNLSLQKVIELGSDILESRKLSGV